MLMKCNSALCIVLSVSTACLPLETLHAQTLHTLIAYNKTGDITADSQSSLYRYNPLNQLIYDQAIKSNKAISYQYYATGMQASESVSGATTLVHYYANQGQLLNSMQSNRFSGYLLADSAALRSYQSIDGTQAQIYVRNRHRSVITTIKKRTLKIQQYNAYGATTLNGTASEAKTTEASGINTSPLGYSNYRFDMAADIYYLKARYYTPIYRTFLSRDSYDLNNRYFYVNDNPVLLEDSTGHNSSDIVTTDLMIAAASACAVLVAFILSDLFINNERRLPVIVRFSDYAKPHVSSFSSPPSALEFLDKELKYTGYQTNFALNRGDDLGDFGKLRFLYRGDMRSPQKIIQAGGFTLQSEVNPDEHKFADEDGGLFAITGAPNISNRDEIAKDEDLETPPRITWVGHHTGSYGISLSADVSYAKRYTRRHDRQGTLYAVDGSYVESVRAYAIRDPIFFDKKSKWFRRTYDIPFGLHQDHEVYQDDCAFKHEVNVLDTIPVKHISFYGADMQWHPLVPG